MSTVIAFPLKPRSPDKRKRRRKAEIEVFPHARRRSLIERHARAMRGLSPTASEEYFEQALLEICRELERFGIDYDTCRDVAIFDLTEAIGRELYGPDFRL